MDKAVLLNNFLEPIMKIGLFLIVIATSIALTSCSDNPVIPTNTTKTFIDTAYIYNAQLIVESNTDKDGIALKLSLSTFDTDYCYPGTVSNGSCLNITVSSDGFLITTMYHQATEADWVKLFGSFILKPDTTYVCNNIYIPSQKIPSEIKSGQIYIKLMINSHFFPGEHELIASIPFDFGDNR